MASQSRHEGLKKRIIEEMTDDHSNALEKNLDQLKKFIRITKAGKVNILVKDKLTGEDQIQLYLIGKIYAKEAGYSSTSEVDNQELMEEVGLPLGSLLPGLKHLRDKNRIKQRKMGRLAYHFITVNLVEKTLKEIENKFNKISTGGQ